MDRELAERMRALEGDEEFMADVARVREQGPTALAEYMDCWRKWADTVACRPDLGIDAAWARLLAEAMIRVAAE